MAALNVIVRLSVRCGSLSTWTERHGKGLPQFLSLRRVPRISAGVTRRSLPGWTSVHLPLLALCSRAIR